MLVLEDVFENHGFRHVKIEVNDSLYKLFSLP